MAIKAEQNGKRDFFKDFLGKRKLLAVSVDPGYDSFKFYVNGYHYKCESLCVKLGQPIYCEGAQVGIYDNRGNISYYAVGEHAYRVASNLNFMTSTISDGLAKASTNAGRFGTDEFRASFYGALICALKHYAEIDNEVGFTLDDLNHLDKWRFAFAFELPNDYLSDSKEHIEHILKERFKADVVLNWLQVNLDFDFDIVHTRYESQVLAAFKGKFGSLDGVYKHDNIVRFQNIIGRSGCLVIDSGYHTCAVVNIDSNYTVNNGNSEVRDEVYSMETFDRMTADLIREKYPEGTFLDYQLEPVMINDYCTGKHKLIGKDIDSRGSFVLDVLPFREQVLKRECENLANYLEKKFYMVSINIIYITGGTGGSVLWDYLNSVFDDWKHLEKPELISGFDHYGQDVGAVFGVSFGGFVVLASVLREMAGEIPEIS